MYDEDENLNEDATELEFEDQTPEPATAHARDESASDLVNRLLAEQEELRAELATLRDSQASIAVTRAADDSWNPAQEGRVMVSLEQQMLAEVRQAYPDLPESALSTVEATLQQFRTLEELREAKNQKSHLKVADMAVGTLMREKGYVPKNLQVPVRTEQLNTERPRPRNPRVDAAIEEYAKITGISVERYKELVASN